MGKPVEEPQVATAHDKPEGEAAGDIVAQMPSAEASPLQAQLPFAVVEGQPRSRCSSRRSKGRWICCCI